MLLKLEICYWNFTLAWCRIVFDNNCLVVLEALIPISIFCISFLQFFVCICKHRVFTFSWFWTGCKSIINHKESLNSMLLALSCREGMIRCQIYTFLFVNLKGNFIPYNFLIYLAALWLSLGQNWGIDDILVFVKYW